MLPRRPVLCLVTDRRALAASLHHRLDARAALLTQVRAAVDAGIDLIHVRERDLEAGSLCDLVGTCVALTAGSETRIVVNDRLDVALAAGAHGVHLRGDSVVAGRIAALMAGMEAGSAADGESASATGTAAAPLSPRASFLIGHSVRSAGAAAEAPAAVAYLVLGTVFPTPSKPGDHTVVGPEELQRAVRAARRPVLGIGGITEERLPQVARTGAAGLAAIRLFFPGTSGWKSLGDRVARCRAVFDMYRAIS